jgi:uncharacterized protein (DUF1697 family)
MGQDEAMTTAMVALLRGINVGGHGKLPMTELREIVAGCGYSDVRTYIQSGNVVFASPTGDTAKVARTLRDAVAARSDVKPEVVVRSDAELVDAMGRNPFLARGEDPAALHVVFLGGTGRASLGIEDLGRYAPDEVMLDGHEVYLFMPNGLGRSKLAADVDRRLKPSGTTRNWRTVTKLAEMAGATDLG